MYRKNQLNGNFLVFSLVLAAFLGAHGYAGSSYYGNSQSLLFDVAYIKYISRFFFFLVVFFVMLRFRVILKNKYSKIALTYGAFWIAFGIMALLVSNESSLVSALAGIWNNFTFLLTLVAVLSLSSREFKLLANALMLLLIVSILLIPFQYVGVFNFSSTAYYSIHGVFESYQSLSVAMATVLLLVVFDRNNKVIFSYGPLFIGSMLLSGGRSGFILLLSVLLFRFRYGLLYLVMLVISLFFIASIYSDWIVMNVSEKGGIIQRLINIFNLNLYVVSDYENPTGTHIRFFMIFWLFGVYFQNISLIEVLMGKGFGFLYASLGGGAVAWRDYFTHGMEGVYIDNGWFVILVQNGIIGLVAFLGVFVRIYQRSKRDISKADARLILATIFGLAITLNLVPLVEGTFYGLLCAVLLKGAINSAYITKFEKKGCV